ncbi:hypothetical protein [Nocardioides bruguierae]|uniref:hypothetical protein n=1 Tax=Nocardioides bruguierae TaxID=2945102 RepID=UPI002020B6E8|nr:hypothetical protein [Nocardioides bruguierae]MCL8025235.1 hypothetical protein [Nocardioides bruguierae]
MTLLDRLLPSRRRAREQEALRRAGAFRLTRRLLTEDVTALASLLGALPPLERAEGEHEDDLRARGDLTRRALEGYDRAVAALDGAVDPHVPEHVVLLDSVPALLDDARWAHAAAVAAAAGEPLPARRGSCFFDPRHGPASRSVSWAPEGGTPREVDVCLADAHRLDEDLAPDVRLVHVGGAGYVPWFQVATGSSAAGTSSGWASALDAVDVDTRTHAVMDQTIQQLPNSTRSR